MWEDRVLTRVDTMSRVPAKERAANQLRFAEASAEVEAAQLILRKNLSDIVDVGSSGTPISRREATRMTRNGRYATKLALQAVDRLVDSGDASSSYAPNLLPRWVRDIHMSALSPGNVAGLDLALTEFSRARWDVPTELQAMWSGNTVDTAN
jgi:alkylation response protein AidB-like acyl-CoA dehydrogenase